MQLIRPGFTFRRLIQPDYAQEIEQVARTCYKSESKNTPDSAKPFVSNLVKRGHLAMVEFEDMTVRFTCDRAIANEIVRHRHCSFAQESTRYVNYKDGIKVIAPLFEEYWAFKEWYLACSDSETSYIDLITGGVTPQIARSVLPLCTATELVVKANLREWKHILERRTDKAAHPQMRELMIPLAKYCNEAAPEIFQIPIDDKRQEWYDIRSQHESWLKEIE